MKNLFCFIFILSSLNSFTQVIQSGDITTHINSIISSLPAEDLDDYFDPTNSEMTDWETILVDVLNGNYATAATNAANLDYDLIEFSDNITSETYYILQTQNGATNYWGTYIFNPNACRSDLVIMSPHPRKDFNTGKQGIYCFQLTDAYFYMLSGTNRCNATGFSSCSGTTKVCSNAMPTVSESYRISDMAHVTSTIWQKTTEVLFNNVPATFFVQLHGFTKGSTDPYLIMSNGTRETPSPDKIATLADKLNDVDPVLDYKIGHIDLTWNRLLGFTNTNGRLINESVDICNTNATSTTGRFLHIEQEKTRLRDDVGGWHKMAMALGETFSQGSCGSIAALPIELLVFEGYLENNHIHLNWETTNEINFDYFHLEKLIQHNDFQPIKRINYSKSGFYEFSDLANDGDNLYRLKMVDIDGNFQYSKAINIPYTTHSNIDIQQFGRILEINLNEKSEVAFYLFNQIGQPIYFEKINNLVTKIDLTSIHSGVYFYQIRNNKELIGGKIFL